MRPLPLFSRPFDARVAVVVSQWLFFVTVSVALLLVGVEQLAVVTSPVALAGFALAAVATITVTITRPPLTPTMAMFYLLPVIDGLAVALVGVSTNGESIAPLVALIVPAAWLGTSGRPGGILIAAAVGLATVATELVRALLPSLGAQGSDLPMLLMVPIMTTLSSLFGYLLVDEAESATREEQRARRIREAIVDTVEVGMIVLDGDGTPAIVNRALREHPVVRAEGPDPYQAVRSVPSFEADGRTRHTPEREPLVRAMTDDGLVDELFWARSHDGSTAAAFLANSRRLVDDRGVLEATVMVFTDVTQYLEAVRSRDRIISGVSHELRTPLTVMRGFLELARESHANDDGTLLDHLEVIERNLTRESAIVDHLLQVAESGDEIGLER